MKISTVEQIEVGQLGEVFQELGEGKVRPTVASVAALHLMGVSVTVQTTWARRQSVREGGREVQLLLTCGLQVEDFNLPAAGGEVGEVGEGQRLTELDLEVREKGAAGREDGQ